MRVVTARNVPLLLAGASALFCIATWASMRLKGPSLSAEQAAVIAAATDAKGTVLFASGNKAMNSFMRNLGDSVAALREPPPFFFLALDKAGYDDLRADGRNVFPDPTAWAQFGPERSAFRGDGYNLMSAYKWAKVLDLLGEGRHVLMSDPDVVFLRNPVPYLYTLPACDVYPMLDLSTGLSASDVLEKGGFRLGGYANYYNGGFAYFRSTPSMIGTLQFFQRYMARERAAGNIKEEQTYFNSMLTDEFSLLTNNGTAGETVVSAVLSGKCLEYSRNGEPSNVLKVYPLNQALFPNHPVFSRQKFHTAILEKPFIVHYNWIETSAAKKAAMIAEGTWFIDKEASVPD